MANVEENIPQITGDVPTNLLIVDIFKKIDKIKQFQTTFQDQKEGIISQLDAIKSKVNAMKDEITTLTAQITALQNDAPNGAIKHAEDIARLTKQIEEYKNAISKINQGLDVIKTEDLTFKEIQTKINELNTELGITTPQPVVGGRKISGGYLYRRSRKRYSKKSQRPSTYSSKKFKGGGYPYKKKRNKSKKQSYRRKTKQSKKRHYK